VLDRIDTNSSQALRRSPVESRRGHRLVSTDKKKLDIGAIHDWLSEISYWAKGRPLSTVEESIENSLCFGVYDGDQQVGFARVVTDHCTFAWLCDVFILESHRGLGLGKWLVECVVAHPDLQDLAVFVLATTDAHELYRRYGGFESLAMPQKWMIRRQIRQADTQRPVNLRERANFAR
jgi:GNAT superfamily N-acetyltransferase